MAGTGAVQPPQPLACPAGSPGPPRAAGCPQETSLPLQAGTAGTAGALLLLLPQATAGVNQRSKQMKKLKTKKLKKKKMMKTTTPSGPTALVSQQQMFISARGAERLLLQLLQGSDGKSFCMGQQRQARLKQAEPQRPGQ